MVKYVVFCDVRSSSTEKLLNYLRENIRINIGMVNLGNTWVKSFRQIQTRFFSTDFSVNQALKEWIVSGHILRHLPFFNTINKILRTGGM